MYVFQVPLGFAFAVTVRVGNELGAGQPQRAKRAAYVSVALTSEFRTMQTDVYIRGFCGKLKYIKLSCSDNYVLKGAYHLSSCFYMLRLKVWSLCCSRHCKKYGFIMRLEIACCLHNGLSRYDEYNS